MSQPNWKLPLILAGSLAVLGPALYWWEYSQKPKSEEQKERENKLFPLDQRPVASITMRTGTTTYEFKCLDVAQKLCKPGDNSKWELVQPSQIRGDDSSINGLVSALNNLTPIETIDLKDETPEKRTSLLTEYQLDEKARSGSPFIEVKFADGKSERVYFGGTHPISDGLFSAPFEGQPGAEKLAGVKVQVVPGYFKSNFDKDLNYWRDKRILTLGASQVKRFDIEGSQGVIRAKRQDSGWLLQGELPGDLENIEALLTSASFLTAREILAEKSTSAEGQRALAGAKRVLTLTLYPEKEEEKVTLSLFRKGTGDSAPVYATATGRDALYALDGSALNRLDKPVRELRLQKLITSTERFGTRRIEVSGKALGAEPLVVTQGKDGKWSASGKEAFNADRPSQLLERISGNRITAFLSGKDIPVGEKDGIVLTLFGEKGEKLRQIAFWRVKAAEPKAAVGPGTEQTYARDLLSPRGEAFRVDTALKDALPWARDYFAQTAPLGGAAAPSDGAPMGDAHGGHDHHHGFEDEHHEH